MATNKRWSQIGFLTDLPPTPISLVKDFQFDDLEVRRKKYGICSECDAPNSGHNWCGPCLNHTYQQAYPDRTSGNDTIDTFISKSQIVSTSKYSFFEWIPASYFYDIERGSKEGFGTVHTAIWMEGPICEFDTQSDQFRRVGRKKVVIKTFENSQTITAELFEGIAGSLQHTFRYPIIPSYGITQLTDTLEYAIVLHYAADGDLRKFMRDNIQAIDWKQKLDILHDLARGLQIIHGYGFTHRNFHSGNILRDGDSSYISDFGLSKRTNHIIKKGTFGVLPFLAPEVLLGQEITQAVDIYSFGIVMWEIATGSPPFSDIPHDFGLAFNICHGMRPKIPDGIPQFYVKLMEKCWDQEPRNRPDAATLERTLQRWYSDVVEDDDSKESCQEFKASHKNWSLQSLPKIEINPGAIYTSRYLYFPELQNLIFKPKSVAHGKNSEPYFVTCFKPVT